MKILHITETATGGVASYLNMLCSVDPANENIILVPELHVKGIDPALDIRSYPTTGRNVGAIWNMLRATRRVIRQEKPDIVFFQASFSLLALLCMRILGMRRPAIYCAHGWSAWIYPKESLKGRAVRFIEGTLCGLADRVVNVSRTDAELANDNGYRGRQIVIENAGEDRPDGVLSTLFEDEPDATHLLFVGRFDRQKGLDILLPAFAKAQALRNDLRLHIVGAAIRDDGDEISLPIGSSLVGWVDKARIDDWYASADAFIIPSRWEGLPLVIPEALRNGTPVLCSNRGALPSLIDDGQTGEVFELTEEAILQCLMSLDKVDLKNRRPACRALYEARYAFSRFAAEVRALYRELHPPQQETTSRNGADLPNA